MHNSKDESIEYCTDYIKGKWTLEDLIREYPNPHDLSMALRLLLKYLLVAQLNEEELRRIEDAVREFAKKLKSIVVKAIIRGIVFNLNRAKEKKKKWRRESFEFLFGILDSAEIMSVSLYYLKFADEFTPQGGMQKNDSYASCMERKLKLPGCREIREYIKERAKRPEEIEHLEEISEKITYVSKNGMRKESIVKVPPNQTSGYLNNLAKIAISENDKELISAYAHFYDFIYHVITRSALGVCYKEIEKERFFENVDVLFENGIKFKVLKTLFIGLEKGGEDIRELNLEMLERLVKKPENEGVFKGFYEIIKKPEIKNLVEKFIQDFGSKNLNKEIFGEMPCFGGNVERFINPGTKKKI